jgi:hypothetical protein
MITQFAGGYVNMATVFSSGNNKVTISIYAKKGTSNIFRIQESYYFGDLVTFDLNNVYLLMDKIKLKLEENYFQFKDWELKNNGVVRYSNPYTFLQNFVV